MTKKHFSNVLGGKEDVVPLPDQTCRPKPGPDGNRPNRNTSLTALHAEENEE
jgi:hypothetical protein